MKNFIYGLIMGVAITWAITVVAAGVVKWEADSVDSASMVGYGTADAGDTVVRFKTDANGVLQIKGV